MAMRLTVEKVLCNIQAVIDETNNKMYRPDEGTHLISWNDMSVYGLEVTSTTFPNVATLLVKKSDDTTPFFSVANSAYGTICTTYKNILQPIFVAFMTMEDSTQSGEITKFEARLPVIKIIRDGYAEEGYSPVYKIFFHDIDADGNITKQTQGDMERFKLHTLTIEMGVDKYLETCGKYGINIATILSPFFDEGVNVFDNDNIYIPGNGTYRSQKHDRQNDILCAIPSGWFLSIDVDYMKQRTSGYGNVIPVFSTEIIDDYGQTNVSGIPTPIRLQPNKEYFFNVKEFFVTHENGNPADASVFEIYSSINDTVLDKIDDQKYKITTGSTTPEPLLLCWKRVDSRGRVFRRFWSLYVG